MKILIVGLGSAGMRHARLINRYFPEYELFALRSGKSTNSLPFVKNLSSWAEVSSIPFDVGFICSPTHLHIDQAFKCAVNNMNLFIEKPISHSIDGLRSLLTIVHNSKLTAYVAYPFRHHIGFNALKRKFDKDNVKSAVFVCLTDIFNWGKTSYSFSGDTGGGAILELSHEIDLAEYLFGKIEKLDIVSIDRFEKTERFNFSGIERSVKLVGSHANNKVSEFILDIGSVIEVRFLQYLYDGKSKNYEYKPTEMMYVDQLRYFFNNINNPKLINNFFDAAELFGKIIVAKGCKKWINQK